MSRPPSLVITGTGRSGTKSMVSTCSAMCWGASVAHEPHKHPMIWAVPGFVHGQFDSAVFADVIPDYWPDIVSDHKLAPVAGTLADLWPNTRFLWVRRDPAATVRSMVAAGWYDPADDHAPQVQVWSPPDPVYHPLDEAHSSWHWKLGYRPFRLRADLMGLMAPDTWAVLDQVGRCSWYVGLIGTILGDLVAARPDRFAVLDLESMTPTDLADVLGSAGVRVDGVVEAFAQMNWTGAGDDQP